MYKRPPLPTIRMDPVNIQDSKRTKTSSIHFRYLRFFIGQLCQPRSPAGFKRIMSRDTGFRSFPELKPDKSGTGPVFTYLWLNYKS
jgi:hypothetical protein